MNRENVRNLNNELNDIINNKLKLYVVPYNILFSYNNFKAIMYKRDQIIIRAMNGTIDSFIDVITVIYKIYNNANALILKCVQDYIDINIKFVTFLNAKDCTFFKKNDTIIQLHFNPIINNVLSLQPLKILPEEIWCIIAKDLTIYDIITLTELKIPNVGSNNFWYYLIYYNTEYGKSLSNIDPSYYQFIYTLYMMNGTLYIYDVDEIYVINEYIYQPYKLKKIPDNLQKYINIISKVLSNNIENKRLSNEFRSLINCDNKLLKEYMYDIFASIFSNNLENTIYLINMLTKQNINRELKTTLEPLIYQLFEHVIFLDNPEIMIYIFNTMSYHFNMFIKNLKIILPINTYKFLLIYVIQYCEKVSMFNLIEKYIHQYVKGSLGDLGLYNFLNQIELNISKEEMVYIIKYIPMNNQYNLIVKYIKNFNKNQLSDLYNYILCNDKTNFINLDIIKHIIYAIITHPLYEHKYPFI